MSVDIDRLAIATHEAGHVLLAYYYGRKMYGAHLGNHLSRHSPSHVRFALTPYIEDLHRQPDRLQELWPLAVRETLVTTRIRLAGPMAQSVHENKPYREMAGGRDYRDAIYDLLRLERLRLSLPQCDTLDTHYKHEDILDFLADDIMSLLQDSSYRAYLDKISESLLEKQVLNGADISQLLQSMATHQWPDESA